MAKIRIANVSRRTAETDITLQLTVDGTGVSRVDTGIPFLDHMLHAVCQARPLRPRREG